MIFHNNELVGIGAMKLAAPRDVHEMTDEAQGSTHVCEWREYFPNGVGYVYTHTLGDPLPRPIARSISRPYTTEDLAKTRPPMGLVGAEVEWVYVDWLLGYVWVPAKIAALVDKDNLESAPGGITWSEDLDGGHIFGFDRMQDAMEGHIFGRKLEWDVERVKAHTIALYDEIMAKAKVALNTEV